MFYICCQTNLFEVPCFKAYVKCDEAGQICDPYSNGEDVKSRMAQLYTTGVPLPFECVYAVRVPNCERVETALHTAFGPDRINPRREFFEIDAM